MDFDFLQSNFDLQTIRLLSSSGSDVDVTHGGTPVFVAGKRVPLFNAYDALEMALRDELISEVSNQAVIDLICELILDDFVRAKDVAHENSDLYRWLAPVNLAAIFVMEMVLPLRLFGRISLRLRKCLRRIQRAAENGDLSFS